MTGWGINSFLQNVREQIAPEVQEFVGDIPEETKTALETGIRGALTLARPLFGEKEVADGFSLFPEPVLNVNDTTSESTSVVIPNDVYLFSLGLLDIGGRFGPLSELFSQAVNLNFDRDAQTTMTPSRCSRKSWTATEALFSTLRGRRELTASSC